MTDTFASDADPANEGASGAQTPAATSQADEVTSTLAELESKLRQLEQELSLMDSDQVDVESPPASVEPEPQTSEAEAYFTPLLDSTNAEQPSSEPRGFEPDITLTPLSEGPDAAEPDLEPHAFEPEISFSPLLESTAAEPTQEPPAVHSTPRLVDESLKESVSLPETDPVPRTQEDSVEQDDPVEPTDEDREVAAAPSEPDLSPTLAELVGFRERLERFTREITDEYNQLLSGLTDAPAAHVSQPEIPELSETTQAEAAAPPQPSFDEPIFEGPVLDEPAVNDQPDEPAVIAQTPIADLPEAQADAPQHHPADPSFEVRESALRSEDAVEQLQDPVVERPDPDPAPIPAAVQQPSFSAEDELIFSGSVELAVGPFYDIASLSSFEAELSGLANVADTSVRRFEASHAVIDLHLTAPIALVRELRAVAETPFSARQIADNRLTLTFDES